ncbi:hypothetical protein CISG_07916 [Coccidioides immitis RMSCC 3703]|uniref:Uncharacterized protein n=1 Tax=Coccidioides immitis RMSCC 3703 TaxID=454286 RepID=A0A0J8R3Y6_COCIT|nr:hypothetical protein CISG_07916 [Coccidioides immitis RMSCC 3703]
MPFREQRPPALRLGLGQIPPVKQVEQFGLELQRRLVMSFTPPLLVQRRQSSVVRRPSTLPLGHQAKALGRIQSAFSLHLAWTACSGLKSPVHVGETYLQIRKLWSPPVRHAPLDRGSVCASNHTNHDRPFSRTRTQKRKISTVWHPESVSGTLHIPGEVPDSQDN